MEVIFIKPQKLMCLVLSIVILLSLAVMPNHIAVAEYEETPLAQSDEPVTPDESEFTYRAIPINNPTRVTITKYTGSATKIIIPETLGGYPVELISAVAFSGNENISYIKLPKNLVTIPGSAFSKCTALTEIDVAEGNERYASVDGVLFGKETDEESENYGKPVTLRIFPTGKSTKYTIPYGTETIGSYAFAHCYNLTDINMHNTVTEISAYAFYFCFSLENLKLSDNLKSIGDKAFANCDSLTSLSLPSTLTKIGADAFLGGIDSADNKFYYFTDGVYCTTGTYAYDYLVNQHLPLDIIKPKHRSITDIATGITFTDAYSLLPEDEYFDISVKPVEISEIQALLPVRYAEAFAYDIKITDENGATYAPKGHFVISFDEIGKNAIPNATKIYKLTESRAVCVNGSPNTPFIGTQVTAAGRFAVLVNNDFSIPGDIDGDGIITLYDARTALYAATGLITLTDEQKAAANVDNSKDGKISTNDTRLILRRAAGIINEF